MLANVAGAKVLTEVNTGSGSAFKVTDEDEEDEMLHLKFRVWGLLNRGFGDGSDRGLNGDWLQIAITMMMMMMFNN